MRRILSRLLFCNLDDLHNLLIHIPVGIINILLPVSLHFACPETFSPLGAVAVGLLFGYGFVKYQRIEQLVISDRAYPDLQGWLEGMIICSFGLAVIKVVLPFIFVVA